MRISTEKVLRDARILAAKKAWWVLLCRNFKYSQRVVPRPEEV